MALLNVTAWHEASADELYKFWRDVIGWMDCEGWAGCDRLQGNLFPGWILDLQVRMQQDGVGPV